MTTAVLQVGERNRFEVHSIPSRGQHHHHHHHAGVQKWYMKANHPVEAHRWTEAIFKSIKWLKLCESSAATNSDASSLTPSFMSKRRRSGESDSSALKPMPSMQSHSLSGHTGRKSAPGGSTRDRDSMTGSSYTFLDSADGSPNLTQNEEGGPPVESLNSAENDAGDEGDDDSSSADSDNKTLPHPSFELQAPKRVQMYPRNTTGFEGFPRNNAEPFKRIFTDGSRTRRVVCCSAEEGANETAILGRESGGGR